MEYKVEVLKQNFSKQLADAADREADLTVNNRILTQHIEGLEKELEQLRKEKEGDTNA